MALETSYGANPTGSGSFGGGGATTSEEDKQEYWPLSKLRRCYTDYLFSKDNEIREQINSRRYYHGTQWTTEQIQTMQKRKQPVMTFNRVQRKIDGVTGLLERLRQDPKAYPRTPKHEEGAEIATAALRYVLDEQNWKAKSPQAAQDGAVDGIGGLEIEITTGDRGDKEVGFELVDIPSFFYDPRSYQMDFADARYMGMGKWLDVDIAQEMFADADVASFTGNDFELISNSDKEMRWFSSTGVIKRVRIIDIWYKHKGGWCWAIFSGSAVLMEGRSYIKDEKNKDICKFIMFSGNVDQDGDRYGFIRNMKSAQDGINARQSKMQHILNSKRLILSQGAVADVETARREWARPDGVIVTNRPVNEGVKADDQSFDFAGWTKMLEMNLAEIENFGPNPALIGQGIENQSGRAIALMQQAGIAELGPYILAFRGWKIRCYRAIWNAIQQHWQSERWIRVTDDNDLAQHIQLNSLQTDPQTGMPVLVNAIGALDVDIILDEGPDQINMMADAYDTLTLLASKGAQVPPRLLIELAPLASSIKKRATDIMEQASQAQAPAQQLQLAAGQAKVHQTQADAGLKEAQTAKTVAEAHLAPLQALMEGGNGAMPAQKPYELPPEIQDAKALSEIDATAAKAQHVRAQAAKTEQDTVLQPHQMAFDLLNAHADREAQMDQAKLKGSQPQR